MVQIEEIRRVLASVGASVWLPQGAEDMIAVQHLPYFEQKVELIMGGYGRKLAIALVKPAYPAKIYYYEEIKSEETGNGE